MTNKVIVIAGPTASGKTALSVALAQVINGEVVSADSMQVYRGMDIGTAKATEEERQGIAHHMLDVADPEDAYSAAQYVESAERCCRDIIARGKVPIIAGGTGLYIDSLLSPRLFPETDTTRRVRARLREEYDTLGGEEMHRRLAAIDPLRAEKLSPNDSRRIIRALEIYELTGETPTEVERRERALPPRFESARIVLNYKRRADLYARIDLRVDNMVNAGLFDEVAALLMRRVDKNSTAMQAIGYKEAALAITGEITREEATALIKQASRRYAKRQLTWFRRWEDAFWIEWDGAPDLFRARQLSTDFISSCGIS